MPGQLRNLNAIVTGASSGIGRAVALAYASEGANVLCSDLQPDALVGGYYETPKPTHEEVAAQGVKSHFQKADASKSEDVQALIKKTVELWGRLDIFVANAGILRGRHLIEEETEETFDKTMAVNAKGVFLENKYSVIQMLKQEPGSNGARGKIINMASIAGLVGLDRLPSYCMSKGAVVQLTKQVAADYGSKHINVNAICPGFLETAMVRPFIDTPEGNKELVDLHPWGELGKGDDVAKAAVFLGSEASRWMTGSMVTVDGGYTCR